MRFFPRTSKRVKAHAAETSTVRVEAQRDARLTITDLYNIAKYLGKTKEQSDHVNRLILDILLDIYQLCINARSDEKKQITLKANGIRMAFFDDTKRVNDAIPEVLLASTSHRIRVIKPSIER